MEIGEVKMVAVVLNSGELMVVVLCNIEVWVAGYLECH